jgi:uncharacterized protein YndB with AHSA1/START domain
MTRTYESATAQVAARAEKMINASSVWQALTTPKMIKKYFFGADAESDWKVGSQIQWHGEFKGKRYEDKGEILVSKPEKELSMSHWSALSGDADVPENYHVVTYHLEPDGQRTKVILTQGNLTSGVKPTDVDERAEYEKNWMTVLENLDKILSSKT